MADQDADGTVAINRLNGAYQKALHMLTPEQRTELRSARPDAPDYAAGSQWEPGTRLEVDADGQLVEYDQPAPQNPNASSYIGRGADATRPKADDGSPEWSKAELYRKLGYQPDRNPFA